ncbi:MAG: pyridoxamine 5'-phosphate oxidase family protein [Candidatus Sumerlaeia bacterium]|nr:pyridoxamine 5'-phosphate oxidase family protein [Candidatus Sumerlaeia bacterium]
MIPTLEEALSMLWNLLEEGASTSSSPFHQAYLATVDANGFPQARTVTLRRACRGEGFLQFNTDSRAPKTEQMIRTKKATLLFYSPADRVQIRAMTEVEVHCGDDMARQIWDEMRLQSRRCYLAPTAPGEQHDHAVPNFPPHLRESAPGSEESEAGFHNFAVAHCHVVEFDIYQVAARDPWRAGFLRSTDSIKFIGEWRMP